MSLSETDRNIRERRIPGDFGFMENEAWAKTCADGYRAIDKLKLWDWLATYEPENGFMFCVHPNMSLITHALDYNPHSGASWGCMLRTLQYIAQNGWVTYVTNASK